MPSPCSPRTGRKGWNGIWSIVAGVQEGTWPDVRMRGSLLGMDELVDAVDADDRERAAAPDAAAAALSAKLLDEERRLFYVAATRARRVLVVTAAGGEDSEERPSRFLAELAGDAIDGRIRGRGRPGLAVASGADRRPAAGRGRPVPPAAAASGPRPRSWPGWPRPGCAAPARGSGTR